MIQDFQCCDPGAFLRKSKEQLLGTEELKAGSTEQFWILEGMPRLGITGRRDQL